MHEVGPRRRSVLRAAAIAAGASAASTIPHGIAAAAPGKTAIVIGSGFGGAVAAARLGEAGFKTTVLERGRRWPVSPAGDTFPSADKPDRRSAWFSDSPVLSPLQGSIKIQRYAGILDIVRGNGINALYGAGVGGGSLVFSGFLGQPRRRDFEQAFPRELAFSELERTYYPRVRKNLGASPLPADLLNHPAYQGCRSWLQDAADFGAQPAMFDFCVDWDIVRQELSGKRVRSITVGESSMGVNSGAKNSVDHNYLPRAERTGNVTVLPLHEVTEIRDNGKGFDVSVKRIDEWGTVQETKQLSADYLFMAAGSYYTSALLATAKAKGHLNRLNEHTGKGYGSNGDFLMNRANCRRNYGATQAGPGVALIYDDTHPGGSVSMAWQALPPNTLTANNTMVTHLIMTNPHHRGSVDYNAAKGHAELNYQFPEGNEADARSMWFAGKFKQLTEDRHGFPASGIPVYPRAAGLGSWGTYHGLGGMVMGKACSIDGKVHGYNNLFVVDGALLPGTAALMNPSLTIAAVAERCLDRFLGKPV